jgi:hypothetical protein
MIDYYQPPHPKYQKFFEIKGFIFRQPFCRHNYRQPLDVTTAKITGTVIERQSSSWIDGGDGIREKTSDKTRVHVPVTVAAIYIR